VDKANTINSTPQHDNDYEAAVVRYMIEIEHNRRDMAESQRRIERLRAETSQILAETRQVLAHLAG
jgi:hypothetical protein